MTTREKFKRVVIEAIHGLPYDEAIEKELVTGCRIKESGIVYEKGGWKGQENHLSIVRNTSPKKVKIHLIYGTIIDREKNNNNYFDEKYKYKIIGLPIAIGRVLQALHDKWTGRHNMRISRADGGSLTMYCDEVDIEFSWKLIKKDGQECTDDDQTEETIEKLYNLLIQS